MTAEGALRIHEFSLHLRLQDRKLSPREERHLVLGQTFIHLLGCRRVQMVAVSGPCLALVFSMAPKGTHDGLCLCNTRLNRAKQEGTLCHLFQRAVDMVCFLPGR